MCIDIDLVQCFFAIKLIYHLEVLGEYLFEFVVLRMLSIFYRGSACELITSVCRILQGFARLLHALGFELKKIQGKVE